MLYRCNLLREKLLKTLLIPVCKRSAESKMSHSTPIPFISDYTAKHCLEMPQTKFFNHIAHGIVALHRLGADSQRIQRYTDPYSARLVLRSSVNEVNEEKDLAELLGTRKSFFLLYDEFEQRLQKNNGSLELLIAQNLPSLVAGLGGNAFHGIIHLGYGYAAKSREMVLEGLAFMHFAYMAPTLSKDAPQAIQAKPARSILEVLDKATNDPAISEVIKSEESRKEWANLKVSHFGYLMRLLVGRFGDELVSWAHSIEPPKEAQEDIKSLARWAVNSAITVYAASEQRNDFFLLHGVTSAWSLLQVVTVLDNQDSKREAIRHFLCALLAAYLVQGSPHLHLDWLTGDLDEATNSWDVLIERTLANDADTHIFKLVQVCHDMDMENSDPNLTRLYKKASLVALEHPLFFNPVPK